MRDWIKTTVLMLAHSFVGVGAAGLAAYDLYYQQAPVDVGWMVALIIVGLSIALLWIIYWKALMEGAV